LARNYQEMDDHKDTKNTKASKDDFPGGAGKHAHGKRGHGTEYAIRELGA
jgi:hypothetical protein